MSFSFEHQNARAVHVNLMERFYDFPTSEKIRFLKLTYGSKIENSLFTKGFLV